MDIIKSALADAKKEAEEIIEKCDRNISGYQNDCKVLQDEMADIAAQIGKILEFEKLELAKKLEAQAAIRVIEKLGSGLAK